MAATITLAQASVTGTSILTPEQKSAAPFAGSAVSKVGQVSVTAGTAVTLTLAVTDLLSYPLINIAVANANANHTISVPAASTCAGVKVRFARSDAVLAGQTMIIAPVGGAGSLAGGILLSASTLNVPAANQRVTFTATSILGDWVELYSNGSVWLVSGASTVAAGLASS